MRKIIFIALFWPTFLQAQRVFDLSNLPQDVALPSPNVTIEKTSLPEFANNAGTASAYATCNYTYADLTTSNGGITLPSGFEGSTNGGSSYQTSFTGLSSGSGTLRVRVAASTAAGTYGPININFTIGGVTVKTCSVTATVSNSATLSASPTSITGLNGTSGTAGTPQTDTITFSGTTISATAPSNTEISQDGGSTWNSSQSFSSSSPLALKIRTTAAAPAGAISGNLHLSGTGVTAVDVPVSGTVSSGVLAVAKFSFSKTTKSCSGWNNVYGEPNISVLTGTDAATGITFTSVATANWTPNGSSGFDGNGTMSGTFFNDCSGTSSAPMYNGWVNAAVYDHAKPQGVIGGCNPAKTYTIALTGVTQGGTLRRTDVYVEGTTLSPMKWFDAKANTSNGATFTGVSPDASGNIKIFVCADASSPEQGHMDAFTVTQEN